MLDVVKSYHVGVFTYAPILNGEDSIGRTITPAVTSKPLPVILLLSATEARAPLTKFSEYSLYAL